ncbi:C-type lectin domain family 10 member A-like [Coregonus clupeaformis]|uniref:C-type lectin domain family 10 member A-like n=1 Tax=Coregonus clupeaformis TaxID=59861 RepID=UPI001BDFD3FA|nr:C-type lectin domain family 10 member A-like [Coregonus clupeaformis]
MKMSEDKYANLDQLCNKGASKNENAYEDDIASQDSRDKTKKDATSKIRPGANPSSSDNSRRRPSRAAAVCLGLLCVLLLAGIVGLGLHHKHIFSEFEDCKASNINLAKMKDQLQISFNNITKEKDQLQTSFNTMKKETDQLQTSFNTMTKEADQLQTSYNTMKKERDQLQTSFNTMTKETDQLQTSYNTMKKERDQLQTSFNTMTKEADQLQTSYNTMKKERDQLQTSFSDLKQAGPKGWTLFQSSWYYISSEVKSWDESRQDCLERGADLVIINSKEEQTFLTMPDKRVWIGLTDKDREGTWKWVDGTPLTTAYWSGQQPDNGNGDPIYGEEDCAEIVIMWIWNDISCANHFNWVCEKVINSVII